MSHPAIASSSGDAHSHMKSSVDPGDFQWHSGYPSVCFEDTIADAHGCSVCCDVCCDTTSGEHCSHNFCQACLYAWISSESENDRTPTCPQCRAKLDTLRPNLDVQELLNSAQVHCLLANETKCKWTGVAGPNCVELIRHVLHKHDMQPSSAMLEQHIQWIRLPGASAPGAESEAARRRSRVKFVGGIIGEAGLEFSRTFLELDPVVELFKDMQFLRESDFNADKLFQMIDLYFLKTMKKIMGLFCVICPDATHFRDLALLFQSAAEDEGHAWRRLGHNDTRQQQAQLCIGLEPYLAALRRGDLRNTLVSPDVQEPPLCPGQAGYLDWCDVRHFQSYPEEECRSIEEVVEGVEYTGAASVQSLCSNLLLCYALASARIHVPDRTWIRLMDEVKPIIFRHTTNHWERIKKCFQIHVQQMPDGQHMLATFGSAFCDAVIPQMHRGLPSFFQSIPGFIHQALPCTEGQVRHFIDRLRSILLVEHR